jgi:hypothetical protein
MSWKKNKPKRLSEQTTNQKYNWGLHPILGPEWFNYYLKKKNELYFYPKAFTEEAYQEHPQTLDKGAWLPSRPSPNDSDGVLLQLNKSTKTISTFSPVLRDPRASRAIMTTARFIPEINEYDVVILKGFDDSTSLGKVKDLAAKAKTIQGKAPAWTHDREKELEFQEFKYEVLEDVSDIDWFHSTSMKNLKSILATGLKPSKSSAQGEGWTQLNFNLQNAVYLTADREYAEDIAETLLARFDVPGVVLRIKGSALKDYTKLVVDEDSLRNEIDGSVSGGLLISDLPDYMTSFVDKIEALGYKGVISPSDLKVELVVALEEKPLDYEDDEWHPWDPEVLIYTWDEWKEYMQSKGTKLESVSQRLKRVLKESLVLEQDAPEADLNIPEPPDTGDATADTGLDDTTDASDGLDLDGGTDAGGDLGGGLDGEEGDLDGDLGDDADGGMDFGGGGFGGGGGGGFDFGGDDGGDFGGDEAGGEEGGDEADSEPEEPTDPVEFAVEEAKKLAEENQNIQQILNVVKSIITDRSITPEQLNSIVQQLQGENDIVLSAVSNRLSMFAKGF